MSTATTVHRTRAPKHSVRRFFRELWINKALYIMLLPACAFLFCFNYLPLFGLTIVFKNFDYGLGIFGSPWAEPWYSNFIFLFQNSGTLRAVKNTLITNVMFIVGGTVSAVALAIFLNEIGAAWYKRVLQSFTLLPFSSRSSSSPCSSTSCFPTIRA